MIRCAGDLNALTAGRVCAYGYIDGGGGFPASGASFYYVPGFHSTHWERRG